MEAGHYRCILEDFFGADEDNASDPVEASRIGPSGDDHAGVESGDAEPGDNTGSVVRQPAVASTLESTPEAPSNVNVHADSHGVKFDFDQRSPDDDTSGVARPALDFNTVFRSL